MFWLLLSQVTPPAPTPAFDWKVILGIAIAALWPFIAKWLGINIPVVNPTPAPTPPPVPNPNPNPLPVDPNVPVPPNHPIISQLISTLLPLLIQYLVPILVPQVKAAVKSAMNEDRMELAASKATSNLAA